MQFHENLYAQFEILVKSIPESTIYKTSPFGQVMNRRHTSIICLSSNPVHERIFTSMCQGIVQYSPLINGK